MFILDTDIFSMLAKWHSRVTEQYRRQSDIVTLSIVSRIEVLKGRFDFVIKASDGNDLLRAQAWLEQSERELAKIPIVTFGVAAAAEFDRLRQDRKLRKIGRTDLLIAAIAIAQRGTVVTRNVRDFRQVRGLNVENWAD